MKKYLTIIFYFTLIFNTIAQTHSIEGLIKNENNEAVPFTAVTLFKMKDSSLIKANIADENGNFKFSNIPQGSYYLKMSSLGFQNFQSSELIINDKDIVLPPYVLKLDNKSLKEVVIQAQKPIIEVLADKTVFNVTNTLSAAGTNAFELLRKAPGVIVDNNDNLIVEGKAGVQIFIDGKPSILTGQDLTNYLKTLQASDIENVEIITQPSSKFDAAGNAGIVNIRLKKDKRFGTNGTLSTGIASGIYTKNNNSLSLNHRSKKTNFFGTYSNRLGKNQSFIDLYRLQNNSIYDLKTISVDDAISQNVKTGMDVFINNKMTFGVIVNGNFNYGQSVTNSRTPIRLVTEEAPNQVLVAQSISDYNNQNMLFNSNFRYADTLGRVWNTDFDYGFYTAKRLNYQPNFYYNGNESAVINERFFEMNTPINIHILTFKSDYEQSFLKGKLGIGFKLSNVKTDNQFDFYDFNKGVKTKNDERSNRFNYSEHINALYVNYNRQWKKLNFQGGLRLEQTVSDGQLISTQINSSNQVKRNYVNLFPSAGLSYSVNAQNLLSLTYSRRIERPNYNLLNPFEWKTDELSYRKGNAFLLPQYTHNLKISHTYKYTLTTSLSYSYVQDFFAQITDTTEGVRNFIMTQNIANQTVLNLGVSYPFQIKKWWNVYMSVNAFRSSFESKNSKFIPLTQTTASLYAQNNFSLPHEWSFEVSGWYSSPSIWGGTYRCNGLGSLDIAFQKKFLNNKLAARLSISDILFTSPWYGNMQYGELKITGRGGWESRQIRLNFNYNFGNNQVKSARNRRVGLEDESGRI